MTKKDILEQARRESQQRGIPITQVLTEQLEKLHGIIERSEVLEMHEGCTPNSGCPVAALRRDYLAFKQLLP